MEYQQKISAEYEGQKRGREKLQTKTGVIKHAGHT